MTKQSTALERRRLFKAGGAATVGVAMPGLALGADRPVRIGFVSPATGPLSAPFAEADRFVIDALAPMFAKGIEIGGKTRTVEVIAGDSQSNPNRAAEVASDLDPQGQDRPDAGLVHA
ncbi:MAG: hypothetical protein R3E68_12410 [Burkholderiaceae bacterium]